MKSVIPVILFAMFVTAGAWAAESRVDDALLASARKALPQDITTNEMVRVTGTDRLPKSGLRGPRAGAIVNAL